MKILFLLGIVFLLLFIISAILISLCEKGGFHNWKRTNKYIEKIYSSGRIEVEYYYVCEKCDEVSIF